MEHCIYTREGNGPNTIVMAKKSKQTKNAKGKKTQKSKGGAKRSRGGARVSARAAELANLLHNPCQADVPRGAVYGGENGVITRFASESSIGGAAGETAGVIAFHPNDNTVCIISQASPATTFAINAGSFVYNQVPGQSFLLGSAAKMRSIAACIQAMSNVSALNCTGDVACGNLTLSSLYATAASVNSIFSLLTTRAPINRKTFEAKLVPGSFDDKYARVITGANPSLTGTDDSDTNVVVLAWRGLPAATGLNYRLTNVVEWTPLLASGLTVSSSTSSGIKHEAVTQAMSRGKPGWWNNFVEGVQEDFGQVARYATREAMVKGARYLLAGAEEAAETGAVVMLA